MNVVQLATPPLSPELIAHFRSIVGDKYAATDAADIAPYLTEERDLFHGRSPLVLRPGSTAEVSAICRLASDHRVALVPQGRRIFKSLTVLDNLQLAAKASRKVLTNLARFGRNGSSRIDEILETIGLRHKANNIAGLLAHGEKQWLELGMVMLQDPELLLIDEPVAGMTPRESEKTGELLMAMARKHTLLVIEHDMTFVRQIAQRVTVLDEGRILCEGTVEEVQKDPKVIQVYLGQDREVVAI